jgi:transposase
MGAPLAARLSDDGIDAADVPAKLATRVRMLSVGHGRKNDDADAISVGIAALTASGLRSAAVEESAIALRALVEHRDDVVRTRTQTINRLHVLLTQLLPAGAPRGLNADTAAQLLRTVRPRAAGPRTLRRLAADLIAEIRHLDRRVATVTIDISDAVAASGSTLTELRGGREASDRDPGCPADFGDPRGGQVGSPRPTTGDTSVWAVVQACQATRPGAPEPTTQQLPPR